MNWSEAIKQRDAHGWLTDLALTCDAIADDDDPLPSEIAAALEKDEAGRTSGKKE